MGHTLVIFGASGDLTKRKLIPAMYNLFRTSYLPSSTRIVGCSRSEFSHEQWRESLKESTKEFVSDFSQGDWDGFEKQIFYVPVNVKSTEKINQFLIQLGEIEQGDQTERIYYLSTSPMIYQDIIKNLGAAHESEVGGRDPLKGNQNRRIVIEKPFGTDSKTSQELNTCVHSVFDESQVFRIDHYLGKETVQNLMVLRFANAIFEPLWNRNYIDHVQITVAESVDVGSRGSYYDKAGVLRDMFQNHLLQLMTITAMEAPVRFEADMVRDEKVKVLRAIREMSSEEIAENTIRGQYEGYLGIEDVSSESKTATFSALKLFVDNWRWQGVPFYLRSGKALSCRTTQIVIQFHDPPYILFGNQNKYQWANNQLVIQIQPQEGIQLHFQTKVPQSGMKTRLSELKFNFDDEFGGSLPDAYQRLLLDALKNDPSLFARSDEVELAWNVIDPIIESWMETGLPEMLTYPKLSWGPPECAKLMGDADRSWFDSCPVI